MQFIVGIIVGAFVMGAFLDPVAMGELIQGFGNTFNEKAPEFLDQISAPTE
jgi:hypothetical protein